MSVVRRSAGLRLYDGGVPARRDDDMPRGQLLLRPAHPARLRRRAAAGLARRPRRPRPRGRRGHTRLHRRRDAAAVREPASVDVPRRLAGPALLPPRPVQPPRRRTDAPALGQTRRRLYA